tara:strand:- start:1477 stop:3330 length:1854 start_codon:yes stop_codon:yes gene_type:complete
LPLTNLKFNPGIVRVATSGANEGGWHDGDKVRFRYGYPQPIGGWEQYSSDSYVGTCRSMKNWVTLDLSNYLGVGTHLKFYIEEGEVFNDITPIRETQALSNPFTATNGSTVLTIVDTGHGAALGDYVTFSGAATLGGTVTAAVLNAEHQIATIVSSNSYTITLAAAANSSDSNNGGASVSAVYQINIGLDVSVTGNGWGAGPWGTGAWGAAATIGSEAQLRIWEQDNFGEDLVFNIRNGSIFYWDKTNGVSNRAVTLDSLSTDSLVPTIATQVLISDRDRHLICLGCDSGDGTQDPLLIRWSDQEDPFTWTSTATNTAGDHRIGSGSAIVKGIETNRELVIFTESTVFSLQYIGPPFTFGLNQIGSGITVYGPNAFAVTSETIFWMGKNKFYVYDGTVRELPCPVITKVFQDINKDESLKVTAGVNTEFNEITWWYPTASSEENDVYVTYNYADNIWYYGTMERTFWIDRGNRFYPIAASKTDNLLYNHELGLDDGSTTPSTSLEAYIESSDIDLGDGEQFMFIRRILPDVKFTGSNVDSPALIMTTKMKRNPGSGFTDTEAATTTRTATSPIEKHTEQLNVRLRGRSVAMRLQSTTLGTHWTLGVPKADIRPDGKR